MPGKLWIQWIGLQSLWRRKSFNQNFPNGLVENSLTYIFSFTYSNKQQTRFKVETTNHSLASSDILYCAWRECFVVFLWILSLYLYVSSVKKYFLAWVMCRLLRAQLHVTHLNKKKTTCVKYIAVLQQKPSLKWKYSLSVVSCLSRHSPDTSASCYGKWLSGTLTLNTYVALCEKTIMSEWVTLWELIALYTHHAGEVQLRGAAGSTTH